MLSHSCSSEVKQEASESISAFPLPLGRVHPSCLLQRVGLGGAGSTRHLGSKVKLRPLWLGSLAYKKGSPAFLPRQGQAKEKERHLRSLMCLCQAA